MSLFIKICGLRTPDAVDACVELGVDAIGFVFAESSVRYIEPAGVRALRERVPSSVEGVGVFQRVPVERILADLEESGLGTAQLHGEYGPAEIAQLEASGHRVIRALTVSRFLHSTGKLPGRVLIDGDDPGSGVAFPAALLAEPSLGGRTLPPDWILAGGLTPAGVAARVRELAPGGVDVSSGVESSRGIKSVALISDFVHAARS